MNSNAMRAHYLLELGKFIARYTNISKNVHRVSSDKADFFLVK